MYKWLNIETIKQMTIFKYQVETVNPSWDTVHYKTICNFPITDFLSYFWSFLMELFKEGFLNFIHYSWLAH